MNFSNYITGWMAHRVLSSTRSDPTTTATKHIILESDSVRDAVSPDMPESEWYDDESFEIERRFSSSRCTKLVASSQRFGHSMDQLLKACKEDEIERDATYNLSSCVSCGRKFHYSGTSL